MSCCFLIGWQLAVSAVSAGILLFVDWLGAGILLSMFSWLLYTVVNVWLGAAYCCQCLTGCCILLLFGWLLYTVVIVWFVVVYRCYCLAGCCMLLSMFGWLLYTVVNVWLVAVCCCYCLSG